MSSGVVEGEAGDTTDKMSKSNDPDPSDTGPTPSDDRSGSGAGEDGGKNKISGESPPPQAQVESGEAFPSYQQQQHPIYYESPSQNASGGYDLQAVLFQQQAGSAQFGRQYPAGIPPLPLSPAVASSNTALIPPASPIFPAAAGVLEHLESPVAQRLPNNSGEPSPGPSYVQTQGLPAGMPLYSGVQYQGYGSAGVGYANPSEGVSPPHSPEQRDRSTFPQGQQPIFPPTAATPSPQLHPQAMPVPFRSGVGRSANQSHRSPSFEEMLPPSALEQDRSQYSSFAAAQLSPQPNGTAMGADYYAQQASWGYSPGGYTGTVQDQQYQPRHGQGHAMHGHRHPRQSPHSPGGHRGHGMPYYAATTPGPPIQTTASNKGPDGANLFIFHIPNHFTNLDMYNLFCHYGNLISVRIMVEKDTGRSRGFGFVSYDKPEAAAMAIKELNGFVIGNKRLKVQHKQIKSSETPPIHQQQQSRQGRHYHSSPYEEAHIDDEVMLRNEMSIPSSVSEDAGPQNAPQWYGVEEPADLAEGAEPSSPVPPDKSPADPNPVSEDMLLRPNAIADKDNGSTQRTSDDGSDVGGIMENLPNLDSAAIASTNGMDPPISGNPTVSPLINLEPLQSALPDVSK